MSNPTSNFGWQMPTATDLVTDLPADFEVFGQAVDTDFVDLLGGTTGQILSKTSATDLDFTWINNDQGDITAVTAGTGITGGGTSGAVTITNDMATTITASGDIVVGTGSGTYDNLPIGTTAQVLTADTTVSPYKVKWATPASGSTFAGCSLYQTTTTTVPTGVLTTLLFDTENIDTDLYHSTVTNTGRITIPTGKGGKYLIGFVLRWQGNTVAARDCQVYLNGSSIILENTAPAPANSYGLSQTASLIYPLVAGDYIELRGSQGSGSSLTTGTGGTGSQFFAGLLGA
jgi:hypothetical protein